MKTINNIVKVLISSFVSFGSSLIIGFILPAYLSVREYGLYRNFILYINYFYILNFGYNEGLYIKYGGKKLSDVNLLKLRKEFRVSFVFQTIVTILLSILSIYFQRYNYLLIVITSFFMNLSYFHMLLQQSFAEFDYYTKTNIIKGISTVFFMLIALFLFKSKVHYFYSIAFLAAQIVTLLYLTLVFNKIRSLDEIEERLTSIEIRNDFSIGIFILSANLIRVLIGNVGQWVAKFFFDIELFAQYSLAGSMISVVLLIINSISAVFYSKISNENNDSELVLIKDILLLLGVISAVSIFVLQFIIIKFLPNYAESLMFMKYLILGLPLMMVITILINNLYKVKVSSKVYFVHMFIVLISELVIMLLLFIIFKDSVVIAVSTSISYLLWYIFATKTLFKVISLKKRDVFLLLSFSTVYLISVSQKNVFFGAGLFLLYCLIVLYLSRSIIIQGFRGLKHKDNTIN